MDAERGARIIRLERVSKRYETGSTSYDALRDVTLDVLAGEFLSIVGPSGSGKSTILNLMAGLDLPTSGRVLFEDCDLANIGEGARSRLRLESIGIVFQSFNLFPALTAAQNVAWPLELAGVPRRLCRDAVREAIHGVGMEGGADRRPGELSGGEQQRVAIARAIVHRPSVVLADEPTGNLDSRNGEAVLALLETLCTERGVTVVMVTHRPDAGQYGRVVSIRDGQVDEERPLAATGLS